MKRVLSSLLLTGLVASVALADIELTLIDKDGNQTSQCIKSYSFSNNLESLAKQKVIQSDVYSTQETLTSKIFMGKPVYRKIVKLGNLSSLANDSNSWKVRSFNIDNIDTQISAIKFGSVNNHYEYYAAKNNQFRDSVTKNSYSFISSLNYRTTLNDVNFIVEYTKTTDIVDENQNSQTLFKSYLHYIPSSSSTDEVTTVDLKETGVRFLTDYNYDSSTDSCTSNN